MDIPSSLPVALILALVPATIRLWQDRRLRRFENDPTLPERLLARRKSNQRVTVIGAILTAFLPGKAWYWAIPILIVANMAAGFPLRKRLFGETWSLAAYLSFGCRMLFANLGFWILLGLTPALAGVGGTSPWLCPAVAAAGLLVWHEWLPETARWLLRVCPVADGPLLARFEDLARKSTAPMPRFDCLDLGGGVLINAFALPSRRTASVVFTDALLARLEPDEAVAICAHEIGHLEYYDRPRLRRYAAITRALIVFAGATTPLANLIEPPWRNLAWVVWPVALLSVLIWRAKDRQRNETVSDRRAVALTGDAEALAQGLIKLYAWGRLPRRLPSDLEQRATHPSLARRIRDIRAAAGTTAAVPTSVEAFASPDGSARVAFEPSRLRWTEGTSAEHALAYEALTELRLHASGTTAPRLVAVDRSGHRWHMPIAAGDAARVQAALDGVDGLLAHQTQRSRTGTSAARLSAVLGVALAFMAAQFAAAVTALAAVVSPSPALLAAAGVGSVTAASLVLRSGAGLLWPVALMLALSGGWLCWLAYLKRHEEARPMMKLLALLAAMAAIGLALIMARGASAVRLHQGARAMPSVAVLLVAIATALAWERRRRSRLLALGALAIAAAVVAVGSITFLERFGHDSLLVEAPEIRVRKLTAAPIADYPLTTAPGSTIALSPDGDALLSSRPTEYEPDTDTLVTTYRIGRLGGAFRQLVADDAAFVGDDRIVTVRYRGGAAELREVAVDAPETELWRQRVDGIVSGRLTTDAAGRRWRLAGRGPSLSLVSAAGAIGSSEATVRRWPFDTSASVWIDGVEADGPDAVAVENRIEIPPSTRTSFAALWPLLFGLHRESRFWILGTGDPIHAGSSLLDATCSSGVVDAALTCVAFDGARTRLANLDVRRRGIVPLATLQGRFVTFGKGQRGWLTGWYEGNLAAIHLSTTEAYTVPRSRNGYVRALAASGNRLAVIINDTRGPRLSLFALPH